MREMESGIGGGQSSLHFVPRTPCDFHLSRPLKKHLGGQHFRINVGRWLHNLATDYDEAHFWLNGYVNKQNCRIWSEANPQVYVETPLHPEKLTVWCALWAGGILLQKR
ncbi:hypothetical protein TNCV_4156241 [Trichonephila clavipes]|nr:hypothetical protein TNCV_4156241 [Trichonephila clavipes]